MPTIDDFKIKPDYFFDLMTKRAVAVVPEEAPSNQEMLGISDEAAEKYFTIARSFLEQHNWFDARDAFMFLTFLNNYVHDYWVGLGIAEQSRGKFQEALMAYIMAEATDPADPVPLANAFQCSAALDEYDYAAYCLDKAIQLCGDSPEHAELKEKLSKYK